MSANAGTGASVETFSAFDKLPPRLRKALQDFPLDMSSEFALECLRKGTSEDRLLEMLADRKAMMSPFNPTE